MRLHPRRTHQHWRMHGRESALLKKNPCCALDLISHLHGSISARILNPVLKGFDECVMHTSSSLYDESCGKTRKNINGSQARREARASLPRPWRSIQIRGKVSKGRSIDSD